MDPNRLWPTSTDESNSMISVIITAYNRRDYLIDAMNSVLSQTLKKERYEVIVVKNFYDKELDEFIYKNGFISSILFLKEMLLELKSPPICLNFAIFLLIFRLLV